MKTITLSARFDGAKIQLEDNYSIPKNARLLVTVLPSEPLDEDQDWSLLATEHLQRAYSQNEPDYSDSCVKEPNPSYDAG